MGITKATAEEVRERCGGYCEACGGWVNIMERAYYDLHHRKSRRFGDHSAANIMLVHASIWGLNCHNLHQGSIHMNRARSARLGHILSQHEDPAAVPVIVVRNLLELRA